MNALDALTPISLLVIVPGAVWVLGRTGWTGDRKRALILGLAILLGVLQAILTGVIALPESWVSILTRALITIAGTIALSQAVYQLLAAKLPDEQAKRAAIE